MSNYSLGKVSRSRLLGVHSQLAAVVERAIAITAQDFSVTDGVRTEAQQRKLFESGASKTMNSLHRVQPSGFGHAVDLAPWLAGRIRYEWPLVFAVAVAMDQAATELGVKLRWGGVWDKTLAEYGGSPEAMKAEVAAYCARHPGPDFIDGPHFQIEVVV